MNEIERSKAAKALVAQVESEIDPDTADRNSAVKFRLASMYLIERDMNTEVDYGGKTKW
jgi:hypothetical protein